MAEFAPNRKSIYKWIMADETDRADFIESVRSLSTLERALRALEAAGFPLHRMEVVAQDEFSHDVLVPFPEGEEFMALGVT